MAPCSGCSKPFKNLPDGSKCTPCGRLPSKPTIEWTLCSSCGVEYEFWIGDECISCLNTPQISVAITRSASAVVSGSDIRSEPQPESTIQRVVTPDPFLPPSSTSSIVAATRYAVTHPTNPRTHSGYESPAVPYYNPVLQASAASQNANPNAASVLPYDPRRQSAENTIRSFHNGYLTARATAGYSNPGPAKPKFKLTTHNTPKAEAFINVVVRNIVNTHDKKLKISFNPQMTTYGDGTMWSAIIGDIRVWLDGLYTRLNHRIHSSEDFSLQYTHSKTLVPMVPMEETLGYLWRTSTQQVGLHISDKNTRTKILELDAYVEYPVMTDENGIRSPRRKQRGRPKRRASTSPDTETRVSKSLKPTIAGPGAYRTSIRPVIDQTPKNHYTVKKITANTFSESGDAVWLLSEETFNIAIEKEPFQTGTTKHAYKMRFGNQLYAAKKFYNIGKGLAPSLQENEDHLKNELICLQSIASAVQRFSEQAKSSKIFIYDLKVADSFLFTVTKGRHEGQTWLVDPLLDSSKFRKFSGSDAAGNNHDFIGKTCDAFAHWVLNDSDSTFVPVDIQGIEAPVYSNGLRGASKLVFFDIMAHSANSSMGLGDQGVTGIKNFMRQHRCNDICKKFDLTSTHFLEPQHLPKHLHSTSDNSADELEYKSEDGDSRSEDDQRSFSPGVRPSGSLLPHDYDSEELQSEEQTMANGADLEKPGN